MAFRRLRSSERAERASVILNSCDPATHFSFSAPIPTCCRAGSEATNRVAWRLRVCMYVSNATGMQYISCGRGVASLHVQ